MLFDEQVRLQKDTHQYFNLTGEEYGSVSKLLATVQEKFDRDGISYMMAKKQAHEEGRDIEVVQEEILSGWNDNLEFSQDTGNFIHDNLELYFKGLQYDQKIYRAARAIAYYLQAYYKYYPELVLYSEKYKKAGMSDLICQRTRSKSSVMDVFDYKSNTSKGIQFETAKRNILGKIEKYYNKFLLDPVSHLEACNYIIYSLQMSLYAYMLECLTGRKIGKLGIFFIEYKTMDVIYYPVAYLRNDAIAILEAKSFLKDLPMTSNQQWSD